VQGNYCYGAMPLLQSSTAIDRQHPFLKQNRMITMHSTSAV